MKKQTFLKFIMLLSVVFFLSLCIRAVTNFKNRMTPEMQTEIVNSLEQKGFMNAKYLEKAGWTACGISQYDLGFKTGHLFSATSVITNEVVEICVCRHALTKKIIYE